MHQNNVMQSVAPNTMLCPPAAPCLRQGVFSELPAPHVVLGAASMFFWVLTLEVLIKYVMIVLLADDNGEGGCGLWSALIKGLWAPR
jgi:K+ transporter